MQIPTAPSHIDQLAMHFKSVYKHKGLVFNHSLRSCDKSIAEGIYVDGCYGTGGGHARCIAWLSLR